MNKLGTNLVKDEDEVEVKVEDEVEVEEEDEVKVEDEVEVKDEVEVEVEVEVKVKSKKTDGMKHFCETHILLPCGKGHGCVDKPNVTELLTGINEAKKHLAKRIRI